MEILECDGHPVEWSPYFATCERSVGLVGAAAGARLIQGHNRIDCRIVAANLPEVRLDHLDGGHTPMPNRGSQVACRGKDETIARLFTARLVGLQHHAPP